MRLISKMLLEIIQLIHLLYNDKKKITRNFIQNIIWNDVIVKNSKYILKEASMIIEDISTFQTKFLT